MTSCPVYFPLYPRIDVADQMREDRISVPRVSVRLRRWAMGEPDVQRVTLGYEKLFEDRYTIAVLLDPLSIDRMRDTHREIGDITALFMGCNVTIYPCGQKQSNSDIFTSSGNYDVYPNK